MGLKRGFYLGCPNCKMSEVKKVKKLMLKQEKLYDKYEGKPIRQARIVKKMQQLEDRYVYLTT